LHPNQISVYNTDTFKIYFGIQGEDQKGPSCCLQLPLSP